ILFYVANHDTTPVGLFFDEIEKNRTTVEVSSPSSYAKELISNKIFAGLEKKITVELDLEKVTEQKNAPAEPGKEAVK
ncbi:MAG: hypothetical protein PHN57_07565, partial [Candidatus Omnitrophica bacterium]|nr:hypothetical protein [Candidatus Omnitrophota bacterium]